MWGFPAMTNLLVIRRLDESDFDQLHNIDLSEHTSLIYRWVNGQLQPEPHDGYRPRWNQAQWQERLTEWRTDLQPDVWLGAFVGGQMAALASLRYRLVPEMAQLTTLHVDQAHRRQGLARQLLQTVVAMAEESGAGELYVSSTESESAVGFYLSQGFRPTDTPNPQMFELEPNDIHMVRPLIPVRPSLA